MHARERDSWGEISDAREDEPRALASLHYHRGETSKSLFLFFIAGISFTSWKKIGKDV